MAAEKAPSQAPSFNTRKSRTPGNMTLGTMADGTAPLAEVAHPAMSAELQRSARALFEGYASPGAATLTLPELRQALKDMGYEYTLNQVKDTVLQVMQSPGILKRNEHAARVQAQRAAGMGSPSLISTLPDGATVSSPAAGGAAAAATKRVDFLTFCEILSLNLADNDVEGELRRAWDVLDADRDGVLGRDDLAAAMASLGLPSLTHEELVLALEQADYDCDGKVKFLDFVRTMDSN